MSASEWMPQVAILVASLLGAAFFGGIETGAYSVNRLRLAIRAERGERRAALLRTELQRPNRWLSTLLIGNTLVGYTASLAIGRVLEGAGFGPVAAMVLDALLLVPLLVVLGETLPKELFRVHADAWTVALVPLARWSRWLFTAAGLVPLLEWMGDGLVRRLGLVPGEVVDARQRVVELLRESRGTVDERQVAMAGRVLELARRSVADLMTPWRRVATVGDSMRPEVMVEIVRSRPHACYPVIDSGGSGSGVCLGVVSAIDLLCGSGDGLLEAISPVPEVAPDTPALDALKAIRQAGAPLAIVVQQGQPVGVIGPRDLLAPVVGRLSA